MSRSFVDTYLAVYSGTCALLWSVVLYQALTDVQSYVDPDSAEQYQENIYVSKTYDGYPHKLLATIQLVLAVTDIAHAALRVVRSPLLTVGLQFAARLLITHGVSWYVPQSPGNFNLVAYSVLSIAWSLSEIIRNGFYVAKIMNPSQRGLWFSRLVWLRYSAFLLLYPAGLVSESLVVYQTLAVVDKYSPYYCFLVFALLMYLPGFVSLYTYMLRQRSKVLNRKRKLRSE